MNWVQKIAQLSDLAQRMAAAVKRALEIRRAFPREAVTYYDSLVEDAQINQAASQPWKELLQWIQQNPVTGDPNYDRYLQQIEYNSREPESPKPEDYENWFDNEILEFYIDNGDMERLRQIMDKHNINYDTVEAPTGKKILTIEVGANKNAWGKEVPELWVVEQNDDGSFTKWDSAEEWIEDAAEQPEDYFPEQNKSKEFWESVGPGAVLYHATIEENLDAIMVTGLEAREDTRGLSNKDMGPAVFTISPEYTDSPHASLESYGETVIAIDLNAMKADGYMPEIAGETPVEEAETKNALAHLIGYDFYEAEHEQDYMLDTVAVYGNIPAKYLSVLHQSANWLSHVKFAEEDEYFRNLRP